MGCVALVGQGVRCGRALFMMFVRAGGEKCQWTVDSLAVSYLFQSQPSLIAPMPVSRRASKLAVGGDIANEKGARDNKDIKTWSNSNFDNNF